MWGRREGEGAPGGTLNSVLVVTGNFVPQIIRRGFYKWDVLVSSNVCCILHGGTNSPRWQLHFLQQFQKTYFRLQTTREG